MQPSGQDPFRRYSTAPYSPPRSGWKDALLVASFVLFIYIFVRTGGFFPSPKPTPTFGIPPTAIARVLRTVTPAPTVALLTPTPKEIIPKLANQHPSIRGTVIEIYVLNEAVTGAYVRGKLEADTNVAQAFVKFSDKSHLFIKSGDQYQKASLLDLTKGDTVEILFAAPTTQSASEQAVADEIVILK